MPVASGRVARKTRKGRTVGAVQPSTDFFTTNDETDNLTAQRAQRLMSQFGITPGQAYLFAALAWDLAHG